MTSFHSFVHGTLQLSWPFLASLLALSATVTVSGLFISKARRVSATSRHRLLSFSLFVPLVAAVVAAAGARSVLQNAFAPAQEPYVAATADAGLGTVAVAAAESSEVLCLLAGLWAIGALAFAIASVAMWRRWNSIAHSAIDVTDDAMLRELTAAWKQSRRSPRVALSSAATEPMVVGFVSPSILLPLHYVERLTAEELRAVFAHETEHVRRRDNVTALLHEFVCALFWFDPTKWVARRRLLDLRERACDERVLELGCDPEPYVTALARSSHAAIESPVVACMSGFHVRERMDSIMNYRSDRLRFLSNRFVAVVGALSVVALSVTFALVAPVPAVAAVDAPSEYTFDVKVLPRADGHFTVEAAVFDRTGNRVMSGRSAGEAGKQVILVSGQGATDPGDERQYRIEVKIAAKGPSKATLEVKDGTGRVIHSATQFTTWSPYASELAATPAQPVSLQLKDAELHDVLKTFSKLTGLQIVADPDLHGSVTIDLVNVPWDQALQRTVASVGLATVREGDVIRIVRPRAPVAVPEGYERVEDGITAPTLLKRVQPIYTPEAKAARVAGMAIVQALINEQGVVTETRVIKPLPYGLSDAASEAVKQWVFSPALKDGVPVRVAFNVTINFRPDDGD